MYCHFMQNEILFHLYSNGKFLLLGFTNNADGLFFLQA